MKNDEFDDMNSESGLSAGGDDFSADVGEFGASDGFDEFDSPASKSGVSLGELWRTNPLVKFAAIGGGIVAVILVFSLFGGEGAGPKSSVGVPLRESEAPGGYTSEAYRDAITDVNEQRLERALREGGSSIPIPTAGSSSDIGQAFQEDPPVTVEDPLANWRAAAQKPAQRLENPQPVTPNVIGDVAPRYDEVGGQHPMGPDPAAVEALSSAMAQQMQGILSAHEIRAPRIMAVTSSEFLEERLRGSQAGGSGTEGEPVVEQEILIPAGTIVYAQMLTEANTDAPGPVLARISSGALNGNRILGTFQNTERFLTLSFNTVVVNGVSHGVQAIAIDPKTTLPAVATEVDRRYFSRFILPAAASFIEGFGSAIAQREGTTVVVDGSVITSSTRDLNTREELAAGLEAGTRVIARDLEREGDRIQPLIKVHAGTPIGILFLEPVIKP